jgi:hypothetical protein
MTVEMDGDFVVFLVGMRGLHPHVGKRPGA